jgi:phage tail tube protein FII
MANQKHTQGKWIVRTPNNSKQVITSENGMIATIEVPFGTDEAEANAKLIASAPEMLEGLIELKKSFDLVIEWTGKLSSQSEAFREQYALINKLIKQATE